VDRLAGLPKNPTDSYQLVVGLEVHVQLATQSKLFASDATAYGAAPNTQVSAITLGHPGTLPKVNKLAVKYAVRMGLACQSTINPHSSFDRKNYFYPDLPKGYQITQDKEPLCLGGCIPVFLADGTERGIRLNRIHLEEDAGKSIHAQGQADSWVDFNRAGTPLIELVTEPEIRSAEEAVAFLTEIKKLVTYLDICDGNMEEGSLRCDVNVSVMRSGSAVYGKKVEVKNMNSFRNVSRAIGYEWERQVALLEQGEEVISETRTFDAESNRTSSMRSKEALNDYRYFPDPDLPPLVLSSDWIESVRSRMPTLPKAWYEKLRTSYGLSTYDASVLTETKALAEWYEALCAQTTQYKAVANWLMGPIRAYLNETGASREEFPLDAAALAQLIDLVEEGLVSFSVAAQKIFPELLREPGVTPLLIAQRLNLIQESDGEQVLAWVQAVLAENQAKVIAYKSGKKGLIGLFMGEVMKKSNGKADPKVTSSVLNELLEN
jgi:aspartyl-tRNA(Asn)/glutamyl-tRNA(Gln) amidotransferase subunit B